MRLILGNCEEVLQSITDVDWDKVIFVTDPPFNIGYHYANYKDKMDSAEYLNFLNRLFKNKKSVIIHYPEALHAFSIISNQIPQRVVSWVYNSNTPRQHRDICFYNIKPDFTKATQPYKNQNDKRIKERLARGILGAKLYDWWNVNQVKNVSSEKTEHPNQMPLEVMLNIIKILPEDAIIIDPFMGSGTTGEACKILGREFIGIDIDKTAFDIAEKRLSK